VSVPTGRGSAARRIALTACAVLSVGAVSPAVASAHSLVQEEALPLPVRFFTWGAAAVVVVSFLALAILWREPKLEAPRAP
jgi:hypothetical protein